MQLPIGDQY